MGRRCLQLPLGCVADDADAALNLFRPAIVLVTLALAASAFGIVLHNADLAGLAVGLLILSLARPAPVTE